MSHCIRHSESPNVKTVLRFFTIILCVVLVMACEKAEPIHFRHVELDFNSRYVGRYPIPDSAQYYARFYEILKDSAGRFEAINHYKRNQLSPSRTLSGAASIRFKYLNNVEERRFFDRDSVAMINDNGVFLERFIIDAENNLIECFNYDLKYKLKLDKNGIAHYSYRYWDDGRKSSSMFFGMDGEPINHEAGYNAVKWTYSEYEGYLYVDMEYRGDDNKLLGADPYSYKDKNGITGSKSVYNSSGDIIRFEARSDFNRPYIFEGDMNSVVWSYDENGYPASREYRGSRSQLVHLGDGISLTKWKYDKWGFLKETNDYGNDGLPTADSSGVFRMEYQYDDESNLVDTVKFDPNGDKID